MLTDLRLQHYRSYKDASFEFGEGVNIIVGPNTSGKTNLLEAILVLARGSSYRARDAELVQFNEDWARLDTRLANNARRTVKLTPGGVPPKLFEIDDKQLQRLSLSHSLPIVLFEPNDLRLLTGGPERRRDYLDNVLEQTTPGYGAVRRRYRRTLAQRNSLLKQPRLATDQLFPWNLRLSELAGQIVRARSLLVEQLNAQLPQLYQALAHSKTQAKTRVMLVYQHQWLAANYESQMLKKLESSLELDRQRGFTGSGPHREDFTVLFNDRPAPETASRGEVRTVVLALKIVELELLKAAHDQTPILLLDDVFSELDGARRHALTDHLSDYQTFITTTDADIILKHFTDKCTVIALG